MGLAGETPDPVIWGFARDNDFLIVAADADFLRLSELHGFPPKVIRLDHMNYSYELRH